MTLIQQRLLEAESGWKQLRRAAAAFSHLRAILQTPEKSEYRHPLLSFTTGDCNGEPVQISIDTASLSADDQSRVLVPIYNQVLTELEQALAKVKLAMEGVEMALMPSEPTQAVLVDEVAADTTRRKSPR